VIGAGYIGVELVEAFYKHQKHVTLIDADERIMSRYYDKEFTSISGDNYDCVETKMEKAGINLRLNERLVKFIGENNTLKYVVTENIITKEQNKYEADLAILAIGFRPRVNIFTPEQEEKLLTKKGGAIKVNQYFQTPEKDVYAIGDCISIYDTARENEANIALATNAIRSGIVAALNAGNGENNVAFSGVQGTNGISVFGEKMVATGLSEISAKQVGKEVETIFFVDNDRPEFMNKKSSVRIKIVWEKESRRLLGAQIASEENHSEAIFLFSLAINKKMTIDELALTDLFFLPHFNKPYNYITMAALKAINLF
jgi:NADPH-dependent 2,4-dienoyl-CoA reductase/sulfur reductase-like enzyme